MFDWVPNTPLEYSLSNSHLKPIMPQFTENVFPLYIYIYIYIYKGFWQSSAPGVLSTLVASVVLYSLTRATLMSPGQDETRVCGYIYIYIYVCIYIIYIYIIYVNVYI